MKHCTMEDFNTVYDFFSRNDLAGGIDHSNIDLIGVTKYLLVTPGIFICMPSPGTLFTLKVLNPVLGEVHLTTTEKEKNSVYSNTHKMAAWATENTNLKIVLSFIPVSEKTTLHYAEKIGMKQVGVIPEGYPGGQDNMIMQAKIKDILKETSKWLQQ